MCIRDAPYITHFTPPPNPQFPQNHSYIIIMNPSAKITADGFSYFYERGFLNWHTIIVRGWLYMLGFQVTISAARALTRRFGLWRNTARRIDSTFEAADKIQVYIELVGKEYFIMEWQTPVAQPNTNVCDHKLQFKLPFADTDRFRLILKTSKYGQTSYTFQYRKNGYSKQSRVLNV